MKQKLQLLLLLSIITSAAISQTISPLTSSEYCPNVNITFTVTLPIVKSGTSPSVVSWTNGPIVVSGVSNLTNNSSNQTTTFTFVGKFRDVNINQVFRVNYVTDANPSAIQDFPFKNIKSLFYAATLSSSCAPIQPNQSTITAARCQIVNTPVSFTNIKWNTYGESPAYCFGAITTYEYQLPSGWSIGSNVSTGSNWIAGGSSVTITSDLTTGDGASILIRPTNNCASGLANGQALTQILISRPAPVLGIASSDVVICSGSTTHTITGLPSGATVLWSIDNTGDASISNTTSPTVTLTRISNNNSFVNLTATISQCSFTYTVSTQITLGTLYATHNIIAHYPSTEGNCFPSYSFHYFEAIFTGGFQPNQYQWSYRPTGTTSETSVSGNSSVAGPFFFYSTGNFDLIVRTGNQCGITSESVRQITVCEDMGGGPQPRVAVSPNPAKSNLFITLETAGLNTAKSKTGEGYVYFELISISSTKTVKQWKLVGNLKQYKLNISGITKGQYYLVTRIGNSKLAKQIMIE